MNKISRLFIVLFFVSGKLLAAGCIPTAGTVNYNYNMGDVPVSSSYNVPGTLLPGIFNWDLGSPYSMTCSCQGVTVTPLYYTSEVPLPPGHAANFYSINDYLDVSSYVWIAGFLNQYVQTPFKDVSNNHYLPCEGGQWYNPNITAGSKGKLTLYVKKSFVSSVVIPSTLIIRLSGTKDLAVPATSPMANLYFSGSVTAPQSCTINAGTMINVDLGSIYSSEINTVGQPPVGYTAKSFNVPIKCSNTGGGANLTLRLEGTHSALVNSALQSDNKDVGVVITDNSGNPLIPNNLSSVVSFNLDSSENATVSLKAYPVNTTGNIPDEGRFTALSLLRIDFP